MKKGTFMLGIMIPVTLVILTLVVVLLVNQVHASSDLLAVGF